MTEREIGRPRVSTNKCRLRPSTRLCPSSPLMGADSSTVLTLRASMIAARGPGIPAHAHPLRMAEGGEDGRPDAGEAEATEMVIDRRPRWEVTWDAGQRAPAPRAASSEQREDGIEDRAERMPQPMAASEVGRERSLQACPFSIGEIGGIGRAHAREGTPLSAIWNHQTRSEREGPSKSRNVEHLTHTHLMMLPATRHPGSVHIHRGRPALG